MSITAKLRIAVLLQAACFAIFAGLALYCLWATEQASVAIRNVWVPNLKVVGAINTATSDYRAAEALHVLSTDPAAMAEREGQMAALEAAIAEERRQYETQIRTAAERAAYEDFSRQYDEYMANSRRLIEASRRNENVDAAQDLILSARLFDEFSLILTRIIDLNQDGVQQASAEADRIFGLSLRLTGIATLVVLGLTVLVVWLLSSWVSRPVARLVGAVGRLAEGDLKAVPPGQERGDEVGRMARAVAAVGATVCAITEDLMRMTEAARTGALSSRVAPDRHKGDFARLGHGVNALTDALTRPLFEVAAIMQRLANGDLDGRIAGSYEGDLRALKANVNRSLEALVGLLGEVAALARCLADGDLTREVAGTYQGAFAAVKGNVNQGLEQLRDLLGTIAANTEQVAVAATQTSAAAQQVAGAAAQQMATLETISVAVGQTATAVQDVSAHAERGNALAQGTAHLADGGRSELTRLVAAVEAIAAGHGRVEQFTDRITRIADKTQILSLNAGIEAARAGEQGVGFGIVAQEIGRLAEETALAARDIEAVIAEAAGGVRHSVTGALEARAAVERIAEAARQSEAAAQSIAAAIAQQAATVQLLSHQADELRKVGESNAGAAEQISATMAELSRMVHDTRSQVGRFRLA